MINNLFNCKLAKNITMNNQNTIINKISEQISACLDNRQKVKAIFSDYLASNKLKVNLLMNAYDADIVSKLQSISNLDDSSLELHSLMQSLIDYYVILDISAQWTIIMWCYLLKLDALVLNFGMSSSIQSSASSQLNQLITPNNAINPLTMPIQSSSIVCKLMDVYRAGFEIPIGTVLITINDSKIHKYKCRAHYSPNPNSYHSTDEFSTKTYVNLNKGDYFYVWTADPDNYKPPTYTITHIS